MRKFIKALLTACCFAALAFCQGQFAQIDGRISDPNGASVPGANIIATEHATGFTAHAVSNKEGQYSLFNLPPGTYTVAATANGFKRLERTQVALRVGDRIAVDMPLQLGETSTVVDVTAQTSDLRTEDATEGDNITQTDIMRLPVVDHEPLELVRLSSNFQGSGTKNDPENRLNGGRPIGMEYFVDGVAVETGLGHQVTNNTPTMQDTSEFKVVTNGISAEYGRMSGGYVEVVTKSGTNNLHGQVFEYDQNRAFDANSWGQNAQGLPQGVFQYNLYGGAFGGPIWIPKVYDGRNKTFFYFDYQGIRHNQAGQGIRDDMPTAAMRAGDLSGVQYFGVPAKIYDEHGPLVCVAAGGATTPYVSGMNCPQITGTDAQGNPTDLGGIARANLIGDGVHIPQSMMDPVAVAINKLLPLPNRPALATCSFCQDYQSSTNSSGDDERYSGRIDQLIGSNHHLSARFSLENDKEIPSSRSFGPLDTAQTTSIDDGSNATVDYTWTISPTLLMEARAGYYFNPNFHGNTIDPSVSPQIPLPEIERGLIGSSNLPWTVLTGFNTSLIGNSSNGFVNNTTYQANIALTKILNKHTLKFGYEHRRYYDNNYSAGSGWQVAAGDTTKRFAFDDNGTSEANADTFGSFLLGQAANFQAQSSVTQDLAFNYHAAFIQDDYKVSPKLTLNLGLRWEMETPVTERYNNMFFWDPNAKPPFPYDPSFNWNTALTNAGINPASVPEPQWAQKGAFPNGAIVAADTPEHPSRYGPGYHPGQFAPRFGAAYALNDKTVVRGFVGEMYLSVTGNASMYQNPGQNFSMASSITTGWTNAGYPMVQNVTFSNPAPSPNDVLTYSHNSQQANVQMSGGANVPVAYSLSTRQPREWDWDLSVQRQVTSTFLVEAQYNGNHGVGLLIPEDISQFPASLFQPQNASLYGTTLTNWPIANYQQITKWSPTGQPPTQLAFLMYPYPEYGPVRLMGVNDGHSMYNAFVLRAEKRYNNGFSFLGSYTLSLMKDNTGGPNVGADITNSGGTGGREVQSIDQIKNDYTVSPIDHTHRIVFAGNYDIPIGRNRWLLRNPQGIWEKAVDFVAGGWQLSGIYTFTSGAPVLLGWSDNVSNSIGRIINTWPSYASGYHSVAGNTSNPNDTVVLNGTTETGTVKRVLNPNAIVNAQTFVSGNLNPLIPGIREPGYFDTDLALMKNFSFDAEGRRYLQFRAEATNAFNQRGYPSIDANIGDPYFGQEVLNVNSSPKGPRVIQFSGRIIF